MNTTNSGEPLSPSLTARMIKYMVLKRRMKEIAEKRALTEVWDNSGEEGRVGAKESFAVTNIFLKLLHRCWCRGQN